MVGVFKTAREYNAELRQEAPWAGFNKWCKIVRAMATGVDAVAPSAAGDRIKAMPCYRADPQGRDRPGLSKAELAAIDDAARRIEQEQARNAVLWSRQRPWIEGSEW